MSLFQMTCFTLLAYIYYHYKAMFGLESMNPAQRKEILAGFLREWGQGKSVKYSWFILMTRGAKLWKRFGRLIKKKIHLCQNGIWPFGTSVWLLPVICHGKESRCNVEQVPLPWNSSFWTFWLLLTWTKKWNLNLNAILRVISILCFKI